MSADLEALRETLKTVQEEIGKVIIGQTEVIEKSLITVLTRSHALIEGVRFRRSLSY